MDIIAAQMTLPSLQNYPTPTDHTGGKSRLLLIIPGVRVGSY